MYDSVQFNTFPRNKHGMYVGIIVVLQDLL